MHGDVLAVGEPRYQLTVNIPSYPFGTSTLGISITTANGYTDHANVGVSGVTSWTFNMPSSQGSWVRVCVNSDNSSGENCNTYNTSGTDMSVSLSPPSGNSYYIYPGNSYYIYPGNSYGYYNHHDRDHGFGGHDYGGDHGYGGHQDSGNIGNGGHPDSGNNGVGGNGGHQYGNDHGFGGHQDSDNIRNGGHQDHWFGGHQDSGNIGNGGNQNSGNNGVGGHQDSGNIGNGGNQNSGDNSGNHRVTQPVDHLHHLSNGAPTMNAESSDDDSDFS